MNKKYLLPLLALAAFIAVGTMDYTDEQVQIEYCKQMKEQGTWPKGYQCE